MCECIIWYGIFLNRNAPKCSHCRAICYDWCGGIKITVKFIPLTEYCCCICYIWWRSHANSDCTVICYSCAQCYFIRSRHFIEIAPASWCNNVMSVFQIETIRIMPNVIEHSFSFTSWNARAARTLTILLFSIECKCAVFLHKNQYCQLKLSEKSWNSFILCSNPK